MIHPPEHYQELADADGCPVPPSARPGRPVPGHAAPPVPPGGAAPQAPASGAPERASAPLGGAAPPATATWTLELPAGLKLLSLNGREHYHARNRIYQEIKKAAWAVALHAKIPRLERVAITVEYQPPDRRRRDADNTCAASGKACIDGIVLAGVIKDDECPRYVTGVDYTIGPVYPRGRLRLIICEAGL